MDGRTLPRRRDFEALEARCPSGDLIVDPQGAATGVVTDMLGTDPIGYIAYNANYRIMALVVDRHPPSGQTNRSHVCRLSSYNGQRSAQGSIDMQRLMPQWTFTRASNCHFWRSDRRPPRRSWQTPLNLCSIINKSATRGNQCPKSKRLLNIIMLPQNTTPKRHTTITKRLGTTIQVRTTRRHIMLTSRTATDCTRGGTPKVPARRTPKSTMRVFRGMNG